MDASSGWHNVETLTFGVTAVEAELSFEDSLDRLHDVEDTLDDGSDDPQDKWIEIKRRIQTIRNLRMITSKKIAHALGALGWTKRQKLIIKRNDDGSITVRKAKVLSLFSTPF
jgi:hypothetical protein